MYTSPDTNMYMYSIHCTSTGTCTCTESHSTKNIGTSEQERVKEAITFTVSVALCGIIRKYTHRNSFLCKN